MLYYFNEDITKTPCVAVVHGCNMQGKMGAGVAKAVREKWPEAYEEYLKWVHKSTLGTAIVAHADGRVIGNLLTQRDYGRDGRPYASPSAIYNALDSFCFYYRGLNIGTGIDGERSPIASPKIGCGFGGLAWDVIEPIYEKVSAYHRIDFYIYDDNREEWK